MPPDREALSRKPFLRRTRIAGSFWNRRRIGTCRRRRTLRTLVDLFQLDSVPSVLDLIVFATAKDQIALVRQHRAVSRAVHALAVKGIEGIGRKRLFRRFSIADISQRNEGPRTMISPFWPGSTMRRPSSSTARTSQCPNAFPRGSSAAPSFARSTRWYRQLQVISVGPYRLTNSASGKDASRDFKVGKWHYLAAEQHFSNRGKRIACNCAKCVHHAQSRDRPNHHGHALLVQKLNQGFRLHEQAARHDDERRSHRQASENIFDGHVEVEWRLVCEPIAAVEFEFRNEFVDEADDGSMADNYAFGDAR